MISKYIRKLWGGGGGAIRSATAPSQPPTPTPSPKVCFRDVKNPPSLPPPPSLMRTLQPDHIEAPKSEVICEDQRQCQGTQPLWPSAHVHNFIHQGTLVFGTDRVCTQWPPFLVAWGMR